jgi:endonuclease/exonuclease/phosphatase family metal-dependent hydrolase
MNVVTWNLRHGGAARVHWARVIEEFAPDLFLVQESRAPGEHLRDVAPEQLAARAAWRGVPGRAWGSGVYVRRGRVRQLDVEDFGGWLVGAEVEGAGVPRNGRPLRVFSLHAPAGWKGGYAGAVLAMLDRLMPYRHGADVVLGGDFNLTVSRGPAANRPARAAEQTIRARLREEFGLVNCWEQANPDAQPAQTLRWCCAPAIPYHCDGIFVPASWRPVLRSCVVARSQEWDRLSDHNPVVATFAARTHRAPARRDLSGRRPCQRS